MNYYTTNYYGIAKQASASKRAEAINHWRDVLSTATMNENEALALHAGQMLGVLFQVNEDIEYERESRKKYIADMAFEDVIKLADDHKEFRDILQKIADDQSRYWISEYMHDFPGSWSFDAWGNVSIDSDYFELDDLEAWIADVEHDYDLFYPYRRRGFNPEEMIEECRRLQEDWNMDNNSKICKIRTELRTTIQEIMDAEMIEDTSSLVDVFVTTNSETLDDWYVLDDHIYHSDEMVA